MQREDLPVRRIAPGPGVRFDPGLSETRWPAHRLTQAGADCDGMAVTRDQLGRILLRFTDGSSGAPSSFRSCSLPPRSRGGAAQAAPFTPTSDQQVLERLPAARRRPAPARIARTARPLARAAHRCRRGRAAGAALLRGRRRPKATRATSATRRRRWRHGGTSPSRPAEVRVMRAVLRQFGHEFDAALADLSAAVQHDPDNAEAWAWQAAIRMVRADYPQARAACEQLAPLAEPLIGAGLPRAGRCRSPAAPPRPPTPCAPRCAPTPAASPGAAPVGADAAGRDRGAPRPTSPTAEAAFRAALALGRARRLPAGRLRRLPARPRPRRRGAGAAEGQRALRPAAAAPGASPAKATGDAAAPPAGRDDAGGALRRRPAARRRAAPEGGAALRAGACWASPRARWRWRSSNYARAARAGRRPRAARGRARRARPGRGRSRCCSGWPTTGVESVVLRAAGRAAEGPRR